MSNATLNDQLLAAEELETLLKKVKISCEKRIASKRFAGMERDDVVQEVLIKVTNSLSKYDKSKAELSTFLDRVINNCIKDCYRKATSEKVLSLIYAVSLVDSYEPNDKAGVGREVRFGCEDNSFENWEFLTDMMCNIGLSEREKEIFELRTSGYDFVEIANIMGVSKARISQIWKVIVSKYNDL